MDNNSITFTITLDRDDLAYLNFSEPENSFIFSPVPKLRKCLTNSFNIIQNTKSELVNFFTLDEALLLSASTDGSVRYNFSSAKESLIDDVSEYYTYINLDVSFNVFQADMLSKLDNLTKHQAYCVYQMCFEYWENSEEHRTDENLKRIFQINQ